MEVAYIAFRSRDKGWVNADTGVELEGILPYQSSKTPADGESSIGPPKPGAPDADPNAPAPDPNAPPPPFRTYYIPVWEFGAEVKREYGGINSSGGPQVSGRADQSDFSIELPTTAATPLLYEHCCSGKQFSWVHVFVPNCKNAGTPASLHITMQDVNVTGFEFSGVRWLKDEYDTDDGAVLNASGAINFKYNSKMYAPGHFDDITLLYTSIVFNVVGKKERGWTTGSDEPLPAYT